MPFILAYIADPPSNPDLYNFMGHCWRNHSLKKSIVREIILRYQFHDCTVHDL